LSALCRARFSSSWRSQGYRALGCGPGAGTGAVPSFGQSWAKGPGHDRRGGAECKGGHTGIMACPIDGGAVPRSRQRWARAGSHQKRGGAECNKGAWTLGCFLWKWALRAEGLAALGSRRFE